MKLHFIVAAAVLVLSLFLDISGIEFVLLIISITIVLFAEMINTSIEVTIDLIHEQYHPLARVVKDTAAGGVLIASAGALIMGYMILSEPIFNFTVFSLKALKRAPEHITIIAIIFVVIAVVLMKSHLGKGTPLAGGMPSGHSAVSFAIWTSVALITMDPFITLLTLALAIMVSHSRLLLEIHSKREIVLGGVLGFLITLLFFQIFG